MLSRVCYSRFARALVRLICLTVVPVAFAATSAVAQVGSDTTIVTIAGSTKGFAGDGGPAAQALLSQPRDTDVASDGTIYLTDTYNNRIRRITPNGTISTIAGNGSATYNGDNIAATEASLSWPHDVTVGGDGVVYVADSAHHRIRRIGTDGIITTIAGTGSSGSTGDGGPATDARIKNPKSVALFSGGLFFSSLEHKVRRIDLDTGIITTVAGIGVAGYSGDGGPAKQATLSSPQRIQIDSLGNIYVADTDNNAVRRIDALTGTITTVVGTGTAGSSGNGGAATDAQISHPRGVALEGDSTLYVADSDNHHVRRVNLITGIISHVAGTTQGFSGDGGPAGQAQLYQPRGLTTMPDGDLLVADTFNHRLRMIDPAAEPEPEPEPEPAVEMFSNNSVEPSATGYTGKFSVNDEVIWSTEAAYDGTHSMRIANLASTAQAAGLTNKPVTVTSTVAAHTYSGSVWIRSTQPNQKVSLRLQECSDTCRSADMVTKTLADVAWHQISNSYVAQSDGSLLKYAVIAKGLAPGTWVYADVFSMTRQDV